MFGQHASGAGCRSSAPATSLTYHMLHGSICSPQVAYAVCQLLLGDTGAAADTLGLGPGSEIKCDRTMLAFIKVTAACAVGEARGMSNCTCAQARKCALEVAPCLLLPAAAVVLNAQSGLGTC